MIFRFLFFFFSFFKLLQNPPLFAETPSHWKLIMWTLRPVGNPRTRRSEFGSTATLQKEEVLLKRKEKRKKRSHQWEGKLSYDFLLTFEFIRLGPTRPRRRSPQGSGENPLGRCHLLGCYPPPHVPFPLSYLLFISFILFFDTTLTS